MKTIKDQPIENFKSFMRIPIVPYNAESLNREHNTVNHSLHIFSSIFNFGYYMFLIPFRFQIKKDARDGGSRVILKSDTFHKVSTGLVWISSLCFNFLNHREKIMIELKRSSVLAYFNFVHGMVHTATFSLLFFNYLFRIKLFYKLMLIVCRCSLLQSKICVQKHKVFLVRWITFFLHMFILCLLPFVAMLVPLELSNWNILNALKRILFWSRRFSDVYEIANDTKILAVFINRSVTDDLTSSDSSIGSSLFLITWTPYKIMLAYSSLTDIYPVMTLYFAVRSFLRETVYAKSKDKRDILRKYNELRTLADVINDLWALYYIFIVADSVLWLTTDWNQGMQHATCTKRISVLWAFMAYSVCVVFTVEATRKMTSFKGWVVDNGHEIFVSQQELSSFLQSLDVNGVAVGVPGMYRFDYGFLGQIFVLLITLFIIALQAEL